MNYFIVDNGQQAGPYTIDELVKRGLNSDTLVWAEGMTDWAPAWQVEELKNYLYGQQTPPPPPTTPTPQPAYVQPEYEPAPEPTPEKPKKKGKGCGTTMLWIGLAIILFAAILLGTTCPDRNKHQEVIQENITSALTQTVSDALPLPKQIRQMTGALGGSMVANLVEPLLNSVLVYHNYIFFSTTTIEFRGEEHTASVGLLGKVFTVGEADLAKSISEGFGKPSNTKSNNDWLSTSPNDSDSDEANTDNTEDTNENSADNEDEEIVNDVKDVVKKHVKKQMNPDGDKGVSDAIDKLIDMI